MSAALLAVIEAVWALPHKAMAAPDRPSGLTAEAATKTVWSSFRKLKGKNQFTSTEGEAQCDHGTSLTRELIREEKTPL